MSLPANDAFTLTARRSRTPSIGPAPSPRRLWSGSGKKDMRQNDPRKNEVKKKEQKKSNKARRKGSATDEEELVTSVSLLGNGSARRKENGLSVAPLASSHEDDEEATTDTAMTRRSRYDTHVNGKAVNGQVGATSRALGKVKATAVDWEIPRKTLHSSIGFFTLYLYLSDGSPHTVNKTLWSALAVIVPADVLRLRNQRFARTYERLLGFLMRESEKTSSNGVIWYIIGCTSVLALLPLDVATVSILILSWSDTAASTVGRYYRATTVPLPRRLPFLRLPLAMRKSRAGFLAGALTGALAAIAFWGWVAPQREGITWTWEHGARGFVQAEGEGLARVVRVVRQAIGGGVHTGGWVGLVVLGLVAGLVAGVAEALDVGSLDDNLTLPIISGACLWGFLKFMGLISR